ncbi:hypothetical protein YDYSY3_38850 [Paenibacillus chitinolyticus]|uniref:hypothetical protein n=1 Tax=Paenibacillus chitinolyticus TaxID=79263 RepID=UPI0026E4C650|nr:hypothetical protein [Paenibacillus chitinolyticus]GKS12885.1 hypothetical protein YDYSY3_38850 [Paenibacillus chitinolyticus]
MKSILICHGSCDAISRKEEEFIQSISGIIIQESLTRTSYYYPKFGALTMRFTLHVVFTGSCLYFGMTVENKLLFSKGLVILEGRWENDQAMKLVYHSINQCYPKATFKEKRGMMKDLGAAIYTHLHNCTESIQSRSSQSIVEVRTKYDCYEPLTDIEWIEEIMEE